MSTPLEYLCSELGEKLVALKASVMTVESCTGGGIAAAITSVAGSSDWFDRSLVTYTNQAKTDLADVPQALLDQYGAVSGEVATAMAVGGLRNSEAQYSISVTGVAGPGGGSAEKPVGTVWFSWSLQNDDFCNTLKTERMVFTGDRQSIRQKSVEHGLRTLLQLIN